MTKRLVTPLEEIGIIKRPSTILQVTHERRILIAKETITHCADKTSPAPLSVKRLHRPVPITNALLAALALWHSQTNMTSLAVGVALVDRELDAIFHERAVSFNSEAFGLWHCRVTWGKKRIATFGTEEVLLVICTFSEGDIVERDETLVDD
jgi:hypothetical protein